MIKLDYSLNNFKVPGLQAVVPAFGTVKDLDQGLTTAEIYENEMLPFMRQRPIKGVGVTEGAPPPVGTITEDAEVDKIEYDGTFSVASGVCLKLCTPLYEGQKLYIVGSFTHGHPAVIQFNGNEEFELVAKGIMILLSVNNKWEVFYYTPYPIATFTEKNIDELTSDGNYYITMPLPEEEPEEDEGEEEPEEGDENEPEQGSLGKEDWYVEVRCFNDRIIQTATNFFDPAKVRRRARRKSGEWTAWIYSYASWYDD